MAETEPGTPPVRARIGNTGDEGRRHPATCLGHLPPGEELPISRLGHERPLEEAVDLTCGERRREEEALAVAAAQPA
jgi:hypothetical protein